MKIFQCGHCGHSLFFENVVCERCGHRSGYRAPDRTMVTFPAGRAAIVADRDGARYKYCRNHEHEACNWLLPEDSRHDYCSACRLNRTIPDLGKPGNLEKWQRLEVAKHRLVYQLQKLDLPLPSKLADDAAGLCFDFVERAGNPQLMTGHASGVVTILLSEADAVIREQNRQNLGEPYRTLVGHLRHEVGHYFWDRLILPDAEALAGFRAQFGDERADYGEALRAYYKAGAPEDWRASFISAYATSHAWEDWAETWAHYLHLMDLTETAYFHGVSVTPTHAREGMAAAVDFDPYEEADFGRIVEASVALTYAVNSLNRAMGVPDVYPFVISEPAREKLGFIHRLMQSAARPRAAASA